MYYTIILNVLQHATSAMQKSKHKFRPIFNVATISKSKEIHRLCNIIIKLMHFCAEFP